MYYGEQLISYEVLQKKIEKYISFYNNDRIKQKLADMSPVNYRNYQPISCIIKTLTLRGHYRNAPDCLINLCSYIYISLLSIEALCCFNSFNRFNAC
ncbi:IS3 family transposase [Lysinibacillus fusiformis]|nr:IS3 family transposase [Lysinibacillus fusiformis]